MIIKAYLHRLLLAAHITVSVGWIGAALGFLVLNVVAVTSDSKEMVRGAYLSMNIIGLYAIVPLSLAALATGLIQSLGTRWGLLKHYWVVAKLVLTILCVYALLMHQFAAVAAAARLARDGSVAVVMDIRLHALGMALLGDVSGGLLVLLVITGIAIYKPWGLTQYGYTKQCARVLDGGSNTSVPIGFRILLGATAGLVVLFKIALYLTGHNTNHVH